VQLAKRVSARWMPRAGRDVGAQSDAAMCHRLLGEVSRTFALSIDMLPKRLRDAVGDAYLLCRIVDCIEDDARLPLERRLALFDTFDAVVGDDSIDANGFERQARAAGVGETPGEKDLCAHAGAVLRSFRSLDPTRREAIRPRVLEMSMGMREYATRAARAGGMRIKDVADLERYCYFVAGSVGGLLTDLFRLDLPGIEDDKLAELHRLGVGFGVGLQLVNIARDIAADLARGACFLPTSLLERHGLAVPELLDPGRRAQVSAVVAAVCDLAAEKLRDARAYTLAWPAGERTTAIRVFCSVPLVLAFASLRVVRESTLARDSSPKVSRADVLFAVHDVLASASDDGALAALFERHSQPNPPAPRRVDLDLRQCAELAISPAREWMLGQHGLDGYGKAELRTNVTMNAEDLLLREFLGVRTEEHTRRSAAWIRALQREDGTWGNVHGGQADLSATVESYVALRLAGDAEELPHMRRAASYVRAAGGIAATRVVTRVWLALFGLWNWTELPVLPPELILLPPWVPLNIYDLGCWARQTMVPLSIVMAHRPVRRIAGLSLDELVSTSASPPQGRTWSAQALFLADRLLCAYEERSVLPLREHALREAERWIIRRQEADGSWGGIQPPWVHSLIALSLRGYPPQHPVMRAGLDGLDLLTIHATDERSPARQGGRAVTAR